MTIHLQEVVRSEVEGGLAGPANPIPSQSIDCGCGQLPCPKLAKYATRGVFVGLISWVGLVQAIAYAYLHVIGPTIARRFQFDPYVMEWVLLISDLTPFFLGVTIAYWGDRIHRAGWIGGIVLLQSISYFALIIPHLTHRTRVIEDTANATHMALYADVNRELCSETSSSIISEEDSPCYFTFAILIIVQIVSGIANISYFALGLSYLDDNTKKKHVAAFIGVMVGVKIMGILLGYILAWGCLRIDAVTLSPIESYREQIGAWWLGLPILTVLLIVPGLLLSWFPRMLPSQVVLRAAESLLSTLDRYARAPRRLMSQKVGSPDFWPSLCRLFTNKSLVLHGVAAILYLTAILNFMSYENLIAESVFHVPKPTGTLLGFDDPMSSRVVSNMLKPFLIGLIVITSGLVIAKARPTAKSIVGYNIFMLFLTAGIIFTLSFTSCENKPIVGTDNKGSLLLLQYCNRNCGCSNDANFRPVCDSKGMFTFYSACHAGCNSSESKNGITIYSNCECVKEVRERNGMSLENLEAVDGACGLNACQASWLSFEFGTLLAYMLVASTFVGDFLILLRLVNVQDKAISIGFWMMWSAIVVHVPGKILYEVIANLTCQYWGTQKISCRLHDNFRLATYLYYFTGILLILSILLKIIGIIISENLELYLHREEVGTDGAEMSELMKNNADTDKTTEPNPENDNQTIVQVEPRSETSPSPHEDPQPTDTKSSPLKYGPLGPGDRRTDSKSSLNKLPQNRKSEIRRLDSEDELSSSDEDVMQDSSPKVAYRPLDIDSDVESDLVHAPARSRKRIPSKDYDSSSSSRREFPNPDKYEDPRLTRKLMKGADGSSKTNSFEFARKRQDDKLQTKGDFNEVGIPIVDPVPRSPPDSRFMKDVKSLINKYELNAEQQGSDQGSVKSAGSHHSEGKVISGIPLVAMTRRVSPPRYQSSSGFSSIDNRPESRESASPKASSKGSVGTLHTDF
ncbi:solute carrier organic anion transporter family member 1A5 [Megachile rotundata]|uniref:solute carrier organic anion transporter family member 1A5 n=1 Tax=Megachile rotundata TaxID=143995 RepID=UPI003FD64A1B